MADDKGKADAKKVEADHARTGRPVSPTEDPTDHSVPASSIAAQIDPKGASGASVNAASMDKVSKADKAQEAKELAEEDKSLAGRIRKSKLYWVNDHSTGGGAYIGQSPQNDPKATEASKRVALVEPLDLHVPHNGLQVRIPDGDSFVITGNFGPGSTFNDWGAVVTPSGEPLFP